MKPSLYPTKRDLKFNLLSKVLINVEDKKNNHVFSENGFKNIQMMIVCLKIVFTSMFFDYDVSGVIRELNNGKKLKHFLKIHGDIPTEAQVYEYLSRYSPETYDKISNSFFKQFLKTNKRHVSDLIVDATSVACDINILKEYIKPERLEKLNLKWGYSKNKGHYIGFKLTLVLERDSLCPVGLLIHSGAKNDAKIFEEILEELKRRRLLKKGQRIFFDRGYYSYKNYLIGINRYHIIPIIFPRSSFKLSKLQSKMSTNLDMFKDLKTLNAKKQEFIELTNELYENLKNWKKLKPVRGIIEDFFKVTKDAFGLGEFHAYTDKSMRKNMYLCILLTALVIQQGFKTKTQLQMLAEGRIEYDPVKAKKIKKSEHKKEKKEIKTVGKKETQQVLLITSTEIQTTLAEFI